MPKGQVSYGPCSSSVWDTLSWILSEGQCEESEVNVLLQKVQAVLQNGSKQRPGERCGGFWWNTAHRDLYLPAEKGRKKKEEG